MDGFSSGVGASGFLVRERRVGGAESGGVRGDGDGAGKGEAKGVLVDGGAMGGGEGVLVSYGPKGRLIIGGSLLGYAFDIVFGGYTK